MRAARWMSLPVVSTMVVALTAAPLRADIEVAEELFVDLDAGDASAGTAFWENNGSLDGFEALGVPFAEDILGAPAVTFNPGGADIGDAYRCIDDTPAGLVGVDPTRTIEAWVYNPAPLVGEETIVSWSHRGGPCGTNMSFNYGADIYFGAVGQWCHLPIGPESPDIGWGSVPVADQWHHLVYTYDGTTTRVYADGVETNSDELGAGVINTHAEDKILLAAQALDENGALTPGLGGSLSIGRLRIHDGVLTPEQILNNYNEERPDFPVNVIAPSFVNPPTDDTYLSGISPYTRLVTAEGFPLPTLTVTEPAGATISPEGVVSYDIPDPEPASFTVTVQAENEGGTAEASWVVTREEIPADEVAVAEELFVDLDAADPSAGTAEWANAGTLDDFQMFGNPVIAEYAGSQAVLFNELGPAGDAYQCTENTPAGLVGPDPTRTIEVWVFNPLDPPIAVEETLVAWGKRGGPEGTNMSFNYGTSGAFGAVGHWGAPDIGWNDAGGAPTAGIWHHLVYTFDGTTTRVYSDGVESNSEVLGAGVINTHPDGRITIAAQLENDGVTLNVGLGGTLAIGRVRVHDGVLKPEEILHNYQLERDDFPIPDEVPVITGAPTEDSIGSGTETYTAGLSVRGQPTPTVEIIEPTDAVLSDDGMGNYEITYTLADPEPTSFAVTVRASNRAGEVDASWTVTVVPPSTIPAGPVHRYSFTADATDSVGGADGIEYGDITYADGQATLNNDGTQNSDGAGQFPDPLDPAKPPPGAYIDLPNGIISELGTQATFEAWITWNGPAGSWWQRIFDFGTADAGEDWSSTGAGSNYVFATPYGGPGVLRCGYRKNGFPVIERVIDDDAPLPVGSEQHVVVVWDDETTTAALYLNGSQVAIDTAKHLNLADIIDNNNWLGRSQWADAMLSGSYNEFRIYDYALEPGEVVGNFLAGPDTINTEGGGGTKFRRGDSNADGTINITDGIYVLNFLFLGGPTPSCMEAADPNDDGTVNITDGIYILNFLFLGGPSPTAPGTSCGEDPPGSPDVGCDAYGEC